MGLGNHALRLRGMGKGLTHFNAAKEWDKTMGDDNWGFGGQSWAKKIDGDIRVKQTAQSSAFRGGGNAEIAQTMMIAEGSD